ncbi:MAG TPA: hypothetical protein VFC26_05605, partial [Verrucomicrobiae bacterium]|nr:hypothetical protein [Verrucomicrobiae bacterium]
KAFATQKTRPSAQMGQTPLAGQADPVVTALAGQAARTEQASHRAPAPALIARAAFYFFRCVHRIAAFSRGPMN